MYICHRIFLCVRTGRKWDDFAHFENCWIFYGDVRKYEWRRGWMKWRRLCASRAIMHTVVWIFLFLFFCYNSSLSSTVTILCGRRRTIKTTLRLELIIFDEILTAGKKGGNYILCLKPVVLYLQRWFDNGIIINFAEEKRTEQLIFGKGTMMLSGQDRS